jgi:hypothetical protein
MVNAGMVNASASCLLSAHFGEFFWVSGRILRFKNPVKYSQRFDINHETVHFAEAGAA